MTGQQNEEFEGKQVKRKAEEKVDRPVLMRRQMGTVDLNYWEEKSQRVGLLNVVFLETRYNRGAIPKRPSSRNHSLINVILTRTNKRFAPCERKQVELGPIIEMEYRIKRDLKKKKSHKERDYDFMKLFT